VSRNNGSPVLTELRLVYAVRMPSGRCRRYLRPSYAYRLAAKLELGEGASDTEVAALARRLRRRDASPRKRKALGVTDDTETEATTADRQPE